LFPIVQWGTTDKINNVIITFPVSFSTKCYGGVCAGNRASSSGDGTNYVYNLSNTSMGIIIDRGCNGGFWIAIGS